MNRRFLRGYIVLVIFICGLRGFASDGSLSVKLIHSPNFHETIQTVTLCYTNDSLFNNFDSIAKQVIHNEDGVSIEFDLSEKGDIKGFYYKMIIKLETGSNESAVFKLFSSQNSLKAFISQESITLIDETVDFLDIPESVFVLALCIIMYLVKALIAFIIIIVLRYPIKLLYRLLLINLCSVPLLYIILNEFLPPPYIYYLFPELFVYLLESFLLYFIIKREVTFRSIMFILAFVNALAYLAHYLLSLLPYLV